MAGRGPRAATHGVKTYVRSSAHDSEVSISVKVLKPNIIARCDLCNVSGMNKTRGQGSAGGIPWGWGAPGAISESCRGKAGRHSRLSPPKPHQGSCKMWAAGRAGHRT